MWSTIYTLVSVTSLIFLVLDMSIPRHQFGILASIIHGFAVCTHLVSLLNNTRTGVIEALQTFETIYILTIDIALHAAMWYYESGVSHCRALGLISSFLFLAYVSMIDAGVIDLNIFETQLNKLYSDISNGQSWDPYVLHQIVFLATVIRAQCSLPISFDENEKSKHTHWRIYDEKHQPQSPLTSRVRFLYAFYPTRFLLNVTCILLLISLWLVIDGPWINSKPDVVLVVALGNWTCLGVLRGATIALVIMFGRRIYGLVHHPNRSTCYQRHIVKLPLVQSVSS
eukprot:TRINITY_DN11547_c0_g2_i1.p1 TRINITY_DN11547_c0_g2~~TRINITY_DN11547_c0_g2_i1.p1  ORF type:complete len:309 (-),score=31.74 TRINITY_DN11547_c0_g2_i1:219-1070(-)